MKHFLNPLANRCVNCHRGPADDDDDDDGEKRTKLRRCSSCHMVYYCGEGCARADWPHHKRVCNRLKQVHAHDLASVRATPAAGSHRNSIQTNRSSAALKKDALLAAYPHLKEEMASVGWEHRHLNPVVVVMQTSGSSSSSAAPRVTAVPRSEWPLERYAHLSTSQSVALMLEVTARCADEKYAVLMDIGGR